MMFLKLKTLLICILALIGLTLSSNAFSQGAVGGEDPVFESSMADLLIVAGVGAGGALLGLSTLSFTGEPSEHLKRILVGASVGIIIGVGIVAYKHATKSQKLYENYSEDGGTASFNTKARASWHRVSFNSLESYSEKSQRSIPLLGHVFSF